ncbi:MULTISPECIES: endonuclease NucS domain-containing protein [Halorhodospira]|uniref:endonuclease NucS domain-containing protein n=1 Tax=Halorhodospira TaxID=85108 RepID=UPI001EE816AF|nr:MULTISPECIES: endonuclease NucS domain-containing protein [Halorhodospira]MCG5529080.1 endonuclease NucS [Halorhodospira halophila]MCG5543195.1 endonuclease NucS [Halorhodospira sp. 9628]
MPRYWVIAPIDSQPADFFEKVWRFDIENEVISIGWSQFGNVSGMSRGELAEVVAHHYPEKPQQTKGLISNMVWSFCNEIEPGDVVIARRGRKILAAVGTVREKAFYEIGKNPDVDHRLFLPVTWHQEPRNKDFGAVVFPMPTLAEIDETQFQSLVEGSGLELAKSEEGEAYENQAEFVLEKYLEEFIVSNFSGIFKGELQVYVDGDGNNGQQYTTEIGSIDILAEDRRNNSLVVIELKKGRPSDQVVGQIMRYMGWVKKNLAQEGQMIRGLVICREEDQRLSYALEMVDHVDVRYYKVSFSLSERP